MKLIKPKNIINWFPKADSLTEVSILSIYEVVLYILIFLFFCWVYKSWTTIPIKTLEVNSERIDKLNVNRNRFLNDTLISNFTYDIYIQNGSINLDTANFCHIHAYPGSCLNTENKMVRSNLRKAYHDLDSLYKIFSSRFYSELKNHYIDTIVQESLNNTWTTYYSKIKSYQNTYKKHRFYKDTIENILTPLRGSFKVKFCSVSNDEIKKDESGYYISQFEVFCHQGTDWAETELNGIFDKPGFFDLYDISQCYYIIYSKTKTIDNVKFNMHFYGANEFTFLIKKPDEIIDQTLTYNSNYNSDKISLFVKSKDLEVLQNTRLFFITAILSGLIVVFVTFFVIFVYRFFSWCKMNKKLTLIHKKNESTIDKIINHSKNKHKRYKSRK